MFQFLDSENDDNVDGNIDDNVDSDSSHDENIEPVKNPKRKRNENKVWSLETGNKYFFEWSKLNV